MEGSGLLWFSMVYTLRPNLGVRRFDPSLLRNAGIWSYSWTTWRSLAISCVLSPCTSAYFLAALLYERIGCESGTASDANREGGRFVEQSADFCLTISSHVGTRCCFFLPCSSYTLGLHPNHSTSLARNV